MYLAAYDCTQLWRRHFKNKITVSTSKVKLGLFVQRMHCAKEIHVQQCFLHSEIPCNCEPQQEKLVKIISLKPNRRIVRTVSFWLQICPSHQPEYEISPKPREERVLSHHHFTLRPAATWGKRKVSPVLLSKGALCEVNLVMHGVSVITKLTHISYCPSNE